MYISLTENIQILMPMKIRHLQDPMHVKSVLTCLYANLGVIPRHLTELIEGLLTPLYKATRELLVTDIVILNLGQETLTTHELALPSPKYNTTSMGGGGL
ncbi:hypothetical protein TNCV_3843821 [Trichonephila clavipes]|nr:hypothetical protein TNCV_3843821 [Trichonephila clavipes]